MRRSPYNRIVETYKLMINLSLAELNYFYNLVMCGNFFYCFF